MSTTFEQAAARLGLSPEALLPYGRDKAKVLPGVLERPASGAGRLVLVSAITPTPAGEGKTTTSIGLAQGLQRVGERACLALREPSLGPCFGMKGGGTGAGLATIEPSVDINLHFTGDLHAITSANNLLSAMVDNHLHYRLEPRLDPRRVSWKRVLDLNDRSLRQVLVGLGGPNQGVPREAGFDITAASEVMAMLCLARDEADLRAKLSRTIVGFDESGKPVTAAEVGAVGAMMALLRDALLPNLVASVEGVPALVHGGPFANIAHGCNSLIATRHAMHLADWVITEAGFAFDLGGEKFLDIKCAGAGLEVSAVVLVATVRALRYHGGADDFGATNAEAVERGLCNLDRHLDSVGQFGLPALVAINRFTTDTEAELELIVRHCAARGVQAVVSDHFARGGEGSEALARALVGIAAPTPVRRLYGDELPVPEKIRAIAQRVYGARDIAIADEALTDLGRIRRLGLHRLPICMAKTQYSLSDDPSLRGRPEGFDVHVQRVLLSAGAGMLVVLTGEMMRMPGLPKRPHALDVDLVDGRIVGIS